MINPWKVFETNINSRPLLKWLDPRSFCKASAQESHRLQSVVPSHLLFFLQLWLFTVHHQCQDLLLRIGRSMQMSEYFGDWSYIFGLPWVWPIVCNSFHKLEHDFCTEGNTKERDLEHDLCTEGNTKKHDLEHDFLHEEEIQKSTIQTTTFCPKENNFHGAHTKRHELHVEHDFCTEENTKEHDLEHNFCTKEHGKNEWRGFHRKSIFRLLQRLGYTQGLPLFPAQADVEVGLVNLSKNLKANLKLFGIYELKTSIQKKTSDIIRSLPWKDAEKKTKQQTSKPSGVTIKFTTVHWADTLQTSHYWQGWWAIGIPVANSPNESENCGTFKWKQMFPAGFWPLGGSAGSPAWIEDKVGTSHHTKFAQPNVLCNLEKSLPKTDWYRLIFNCRFLSTFSIFRWVPNSSKPSDYWTHLIETQFT